MDSLCYCMQLASQETEFPDKSGLINYHYYCLCYCACAMVGEVAKV